MLLLFSLSFIFSLSDSFGLYYREHTHTHTHTQRKIGAVKVLILKMAVELIAKETEWTETAPWRIAKADRGEKKRENVFNIFFFSLLL